MVTFWFLWAQSTHKALQPQADAVPPHLLPHPTSGAASASGSRLAFFSLSCPHHELTRRKMSSCSLCSRPPNKAVLWQHHHHGIYGENTAAQETLIPCEQMTFLHPWGSSAGPAMPHILPMESSAETPTSQLATQHATPIVFCIVTNLIYLQLLWLWILPLFCDNMPQGGLKPHLNYTKTKVTREPEDWLIMLSTPLPPLFPLLPRGS